MATDPTIGMFVGGAEIERRKRRRNLMATDQVEEARAAFVAMMKDENSDRAPFARESLRQHWNGAASGFHDHQVQSRWKDYLAGWKAKTEQSND